MDAFLPQRVTWERAEGQGICRAALQQHLQPIWASFQHCTTLCYTHFARMNARIPTEVLQLKKRKNDKHLNSNMCDKGTLPSLGQSGTWSALGRLPPMWQRR